MLRKWTRGFLYATGLIIGFITYLVSKRTPAFGYQSMIGLFCVTNGSSNDILSKIINLFKGAYRFPDAKGVLGDMAGSEGERALLKLQNKGYYVFENRLPDYVCDRLLQYAITQPCKMRAMEGGGGGGIEAIYHRGAPQAVRYDFDTQDLLDNDDIQNLIADMSFATIAQRYLGCGPVLDVLGMWWHTAFSDKPDTEAAQYYHFDMDRPKWLKFFIYLTDVESTSGPHTFVAGSHKSGGIPSEMLKKGYARLTDDEVEKAFDRENIIEYTAPRGTIIAEDTRGLHKGKHVETGDRLVLQIQFSNCLFGGYYPKATIGENVVSKLNDAIRRFPHIYSAYR